MKVNYRKIGFSKFVANLRFAQTGTDLCMLHTLNVVEQTRTCSVNKVINFCDLGFPIVIATCSVPVSCKSSLMMEVKYILPGGIPK